MKKTLLAILLTLCAAATALAQERKISGTLLDKESKEPVMQATIQLLKAKDSVYVAGAVTNEDGLFSLTAPENGKYIIKISNIGYKGIVRNLTISEDKDFAFGKVNMETDAVMLKEVIANGVAAKVVVKEDTFVYNAAAYRTPEGSVIEELVKRLPGAQIDDAGKITINGKEVKKIMVDGKEFMTGDTETALKNLPTAIVDKVKAYQEKSDLAKMTGIDDGEENTVLDFNIKKGMNKGTMLNTDLAAGTHSRYAERLMGAYMKDNSRLMIFANANNTGDRGFSTGGRGGGGGGNGLMSSKMLGLNYNYEIKNKLRADFSVRWNNRGNDNVTTTASENFISTVGSFSNGRSQSYSRSNSWNFNGRLEWKPDTLTTIQVRPSLSTSSNDSRSWSTNGSFNQDPYNTANPYTGAYVTDPLDAASMAELNEALYQYSKEQQALDPTRALDSILVNRRQNKSLSYGTSTNFNIQATVSRRLSNNGRNITVQARYANNSSDNESLSTQSVTLFRPSTEDSLYYRNRYNVTPNKNWNYRLTATYSEPIALATFLQLRYQYQYQNRKSDRQTHDFSEQPMFGNGITPVFRDFASYLNPFVNETTPLSSYLDTDQSRFSEYDNYIHEVELALRRTTNNYNLSFGLMLQPQTSELHYKHLGLDTITRRTVSNFTPTFDFRYRFNKQKSLRLNYRGSTDQPSMTDLMPITDTTDPLNITMGNPDLKPSFTNRFFLEYNNYIQHRQNAIMAFINFQTTRNSVSSMVRYNQATGGRTTQPMNINGNWNVRSAFMYNTSLDTVGIWSANSFTNITYDNRVSYVNLHRSAEPDKNYTRTTGLSERLGFSYRNSWLEVELNGNVTYSISRNKLQPNANLDTWDFNYGTDITVNMPWSMSFSTGAHMQSRRGYSDASMNTDEFVWNAQLSQSLLKGKPLTISLQLYDILQQKSSFSRMISATQRSDVYYNSINSYAMFHVIYRFNAFGGKAARMQQRGGSDAPQGPPTGEGRGRGGNFGGGRGGFGGGGGRF